jgi:hypothetical protein
VSLLCTKCRKNLAGSSHRDTRDVIPPSRIARNLKVTLVDTPYQSVIRRSREKEEAVRKRLPARSTESRDPKSLTSEEPTTNRKATLNL